MCNLSEGIYEHGHHDGKIDQAISTIFAAMKKLNISMDDAFEIFTENLAPSEKEEVAKEMTRKLDLH